METGLSFCFVTRFPTNRQDFHESLFDRFPSTKRVLRVNWGSRLRRNGVCVMPRLSDEQLARDIALSFFSTLTLASEFEQAKSAVDRMSQ